MIEHYEFLGVDPDCEGGEEEVLASVPANQFADEEAVKAYVQEWRTYGYENVRWRKVEIQ